MDKVLGKNRGQLDVSRVRFPVRATLKRKSLSSPTGHILCKRGRYINASRRNGRSPGRKTDRLASMYQRATNPAYRPRKRKRAERTPPKNRKKILHFWVFSKNICIGIECKIFDSASPNWTPRMLISRRLFFQERKSIRGSAFSNSPLERRIGWQHGSMVAATTTIFSYTE